MFAERERVTSAIVAQVSGGGRGWAIYIISCEVCVVGVWVSELGLCVKSVEQANRES